MHNIFEITNLQVTIQKKAILHNINFCVQTGDFLGIIGPNGAGKSTLIKALSRIYNNSKGSILLDGKSIFDYSRKELASIIGVLPAELYVPYDFNVFDIVSMGRTPYIRFSSRLTEHDKKIINDSMIHTDILNLTDRIFNSLSSGEKQRVLIAQALAQEPKILLLDEPTSHLDINHQKEIMDLLWGLNNKDKLTILFVSHDINCAAEYCNTILFLKDGCIIHTGTPKEVLTSENIHKLYGLNVHVSPNVVSGNPHVCLVPDHVGSR